jgi:hypothetical protein
MVRRDRGSTGGREPPGAPAGRAEEEAAGGRSRGEQAEGARLLRPRVQRQAARGGRPAADFFRLEDGKIVEHWDVLQPIPEWSANDNGMV